MHENEVVLELMIDYMPPKNSPPLLIIALGYRGLTLPWGIFPHLFPHDQRGADLGVMVWVKWWTTAPQYPN